MELYQLNMYGYVSDNLEILQDEIPSFQKLVADGVERHKAATLKAYPDDLIDLLIKYENNQYGLPPLLAAIRERDERAVRMFLEHGADPNAKWNGGVDDGIYFTPFFALDYAAAFGTSKIVEILIDRGATLTHEKTKGKEYQSAIFYAAMNNNVDTLKTLISRGASPLDSSGSLGTALHAAVVFGSSDAVKYLLSVWIYPDILSINGLTPIGTVFVYGAQGGDVIGSIEALLRAGAKPNIKTDGNGWTYLHSLAWHVHNNPWNIKSSDQLAQLLIKYGADVNAEDSNGHTPLFYMKNVGGRPSEESKRLIAMLETSGAKAK